MKPVKRECP